MPKAQKNLDFESHAAVGAAEHALCCRNRDRPTANWAFHFDRFRERLDGVVTLPGAHIVLKITEMTPRTGDEAHRVIYRARFVCDVENLLFTDRFSPLFVDLITDRTSGPP